MHSTSLCIHFKITKIELFLNEFKAYVHFLNFWIRVFQQSIKQKKTFKNLLNRSFDLKNICFQYFYNIKL